MQWDPVSRLQPPRPPGAQDPTCADVRRERGTSEGGGGWVMKPDCASVPVAAGPKFWGWQINEIGGILSSSVLLICEFPQLFPL